MGTNPGIGTLTGDATTTVSSGIATFSGLSINKVGTGYTLNASSSPAYAQAISAGFNITVGPSSMLTLVRRAADHHGGWDNRRARSGVGRPRGCLREYRDDR